MSRYASRSSGTAAVEEHTSGRVSHSSSLAMWLVSPAMHGVRLLDMQHGKFATSEQGVQSPSIHWTAFLSAASRQTQTLTSAYLPRAVPTLGSPCTLTLGQVSTGSEPRSRVTPHHPPETLSTPWISQIWSQIFKCSCHQGA
jgi:hypothetical protein